MAIFRVNKNNNYTCISNYHLKEKAMSLKAKGLLTLMLSLPENWNYSIAGLVAICKENETSIKSALEELKQFGYLQITKLNDINTGKFEYIYDISEEPKIQNPDLENPPLENPPLENPQVENQGQLNTNISNTNILNIKEINKDYKESKKEKKNNTKNQTFDELIEEYTDNENLRYELKEHLKTRKAKKATLTNRAIQLELRELDKLANDDNTKIKIVQTSIMRGWTGFFQLKEEKNINNNIFLDMLKNK